MLFSHRRRHSKKAYAGIDMLIIFIALILVAAVAAGVILRTGNVLQSRALATGNAAKEAISAGIEIVSIKAHANLTDRAVYGYELLLRALPSSSSMDPLNINFIYTDNNRRFIAVQNTELRDNAVDESFTNTDDDATFDDNYNGVFSLSEFFDIDDDGIDDAFGFTQTYLQGADTDALIILKSSVYKTSGDWNLSTIRSGDEFGVYTPYTGTNSLIIYDNATDDILVYATNIQSAGGFVNITLQTDSASCIFTSAKRNTFYCLEQRIGNDDRFIDEQELWTLHYRLSQPTYVSGPESEIEMNLLGARGLTATRIFFISNIIDREIMVVFP